MTQLPIEVWLTPASDAVVFEGPLRFADADDWAGFLESWSGVCENAGAPLPVEGVDYQLVSKERELAMFTPKECFKAALVCPPILFCMERYIWHHSVHYSMVFPAIVGACAVFFGILGLLEGSGG